MDQRGRKSSASLAVITAEGLAEVRRPDPPEELTEEQGYEWRCVVNRCPAEWFPRETHALLAQYCRHVVAARRIAQLVAEFEKREELDVTEYDRLLKMQEREGRALSSLATRMRLSQQTTHDREKKKSTKSAKRPWE